MWRLMLLSGAALTCGCQTPFGFGGDEWDDNVDDPFDTTETTTGVMDTANADGVGGPYVLAAHTYCADGEPQGIGALVDGTNVWVTHVGFSDECSACASWSVQAIPEGNDVVIDYSDLDATTCDCDCGVFGIEYVMAGFTPDTWTLTDGEDSVTFSFGVVAE